MYALLFKKFVMKLHIKITNILKYIYSLAVTHMSYLTLFFMYAQYVLCIYKKTSINLILLNM
jgi:hypothetical protein